MVSLSTTSHICIAVLSLLFILGQVAQCMSLTPYTDDNDEFPLQDVTTNEEAAWQRMALVILTRALETLTDRMNNQLQPLDKRNNVKETQQTQVRRGNLFWRTGVLGRPGQGRK
ncbi:uncharacterized protein [Amphiura filiformis]|uniref:uncharacterized protein isoform X2 n=1 Tax=Amphiura filiformis TaxID=82378 RepID=UPI003B21D29A